MDKPRGGEVLARAGTPHETPVRRGIPSAGPGRGLFGTGSSKDLPF